MELDGGILAPEIWLLIARFSGMKEVLNLRRVCISSRDAINGAWHLLKHLSPINIDMMKNETTKFPYPVHLHWNHPINNVIMKKVRLQFKQQQIRQISFHNCRETYAGTLALLFHDIPRLTFDHCVIPKAILSTSIDVSSLTASMIRRMGTALIDGREERDTLTGPNTLLEIISSHCSSTIIYGFKTAYLYRPKPASVTPITDWYNVTVNVSNLECGKRPQFIFIHGAIEHVRICYIDRPQEGQLYIYVRSMLPVKDLYILSHIDANSPSSLNFERHYFVLDPASSGHMQPDCPIMQEWINECDRLFPATSDPPIKELHVPVPMMQSYRMLFELFPPEVSLQMLNSRLMLENAMMTTVQELHPT